MAKNPEIILEYRIRVLQALVLVLAAGRRFWPGNQEEGWICLTSRKKAPVLSVGTGTIRGEDSFAHQLRAEREVSWLLGNSVLTSRVLHDEHLGPAVAIRGSNLLLSYTSDLDASWNEAIVLAVALHMGQIDRQVVGDEKLPFCHNPNIARLLQVAHWTE